MKYRYCNKLENLINIVFLLSLIAQNFDNGYHFMYKFFSFQYNIYNYFPKIKKT